MKKLKILYTKISQIFFSYIGRADIFVVLFALILMHNLHFFIEWFYPITGEPSMVWLYNTVFGLTRASIVIGYSYLMFRIFFPQNYKYLENYYNNHFKESVWSVKLYTTLALYAFFILVFLVSVVTM